MEGRLHQGKFCLRIAVVLNLALVAWFFALAAAELVAARRRPAGEPSGDGRLITNFGLGVLALAASSLVPMVKLGTSFLGQSAETGFAVRYAWPGLVVVGVLLLADSLATYWTHRAMHAVPWLWRIHRVHHSDAAVDVSTSLRNHPLELVVTIPVSVAVIVIVGASPTAVLITQTIMVAASIWQHADIDLPRADRALAPLLITPGIHRLHHSPERRLHDSNYGDLITLWDQLFGTFSRPGARARVGLENQIAPSNRLLQQLWSPIYAP
jgi:sterol desaturase/sphingolipid hydroxylase (fatty acid hydroxylase superfamily)